MLVEGEIGSIKSKRVLILAITVLTTLSPIFA